MYRSTIYIHVLCGILIIFVSYRISVEGLEVEIRQVAADIKKLDSQLNEDKNGIRSYFKGKFTYQL
jgi:hypothetical protein